MAGAFETIFDSIRDAADFFLKRPGEVTVEFTKVAMIGLGVQVAFIFLLMGVSVAAGGAGAGDMALIAVVISAVLLAIAFFIVSTAISATPYCIVDGMINGRKVGIISRMKELLRVVAGYCAALTGLFIIVFGFAAGGSLLLGGDEIFTMFLMIGALAAILALVFLVQFAVPEMALNNADAVGALKSSFAICMKNFWTVLLFDIIVVIALFGTVLVFSVPQGAVESQMTGAAGNIVVVLLLFMVSVIASLLETVVVSLIAINTIYFFWKRLTTPGGAETGPMAAPAKPSRKRGHSKQ